MPAAADTAVFTDTGAGTVDLGGTTQPTGGGALGGLTFNNATAGYLLQNGTLNLGGGTLAHNSGAGVTNTLSVQLNSSGAVAVNSGMLVFANTANTLTGTVSIAAGARLEVTAPTSLSIGSVVTLNGGNLLVRGVGGNLSGSTLAVTANSSLTFEATTTGAVGNLRFTNNTGLTLQGPSGAAVTLGAISGANPNPNLPDIATLTTSLATTAGPLSNIAIFNKEGAGTLTLTGASILGNAAGTHGVRVNAGSLILGNGMDVASFTTTSSSREALMTVNSGASLEVAANASITARGLNIANGSGFPAGPAVLLAGASSSAVNAGTLTGGQSNTGSSAGPAGPGVSLTGTGGSLTNSGTIRGGLAGNGPTVSGGDGGAGVRSTGSGGSVINSGTISGSAGGNPGYIGTTAGTGGDGVRFLAGGSLTNSGTISGAPGGISSTGPASAGAGVAVSGGAATLVQQSGGTINGGVVLDSGFAHSVTLQAGSRINGGLNVGSNTASTLTLTDNGTGGSQTYSAAVTGPTTFSGALVKNGAGTWSLDQPLTYAGGTQVNAGTLLASNTTGSATGSGPVEVNTGATLGGGGTIAGAVSVASGGTLSPGNSPGRLTVGSLTLASGAALSIELGGAPVEPASSATQTYDQVFSAGGFNLAGNLNLSLANGFSPTLGQKFFILVNTVDTALVSGVFANATALVVSDNAGNFYLLNYADNAGDGLLFNDVSLTVVPEPSTWFMIGAGMLTLLGVQRARRTKALA